MRKTKELLDLSAICTCRHPRGDHSIYGKCGVEYCNCLKFTLSARQPALYPHPEVLSKKEMVNHPAHYGGDVPHEVWKCLHAWGLEDDALLWNVVKYVSRSKAKGRTLEDLKKAQWYLNKRIELMELK